MACGDKQGLAAEPSKILTMLEWLMPKTIGKLSGFLELIGYYQNFV